MFQNLNYLNKQSRKTVFALIAILLVALLLFVIGGKRFFDAGQTADSAQKDIKEKGYSGYGGKGAPKAEAYYDTDDGKKAELFPFDPNIADSIAFMRLGLSSYIIRNIYRYRSKGGIFRCPEDFAQIWGLTIGQYRKLEPYIRISDDYRPASEFVSRPSYSNSYNNSYTSERHDYPENVTAQDSMAHPQKIRKGEHISANVSDTTQLCQVPGIGKGFARRIYRYRERLGGFTSKEQLMEIPDMPESALEYITVDGGKIRKLRINHLTNEQLRAHPYIDYRQARDILDYRRLKGDIKNVQDLRAVHAFTENDLKKILPYIDFN